MRPRNELKNIASILLVSPTQQDLRAASQAINDLLDDRSQLAYKILRLTRALEDKQASSQPPSRGRLMRLFFG